MEKIFKKIRHFFGPLALIFIAVSFTGAYYSDSVSTTNNTFTAGTWTPGPATITEVFYDPSSGSDTGLEWIEITNTGPYTMDLDGYILHVANSGNDDFIFPDFSLAPSAKVVVHVNTADTNSSTDLYWPVSRGNMSDSSGSVSLFKNLPKDNTTIYDFVQYGAGDQNYENDAVTALIWTEDDFVAGVAVSHSIQLTSTDNNSSSDWFDQSTPTPGS